MAPLIRYLFQEICSIDPILLPISILQDSSNPLSLSFRLFGNIIADELVGAIVVPIVTMCNDGVAIKTNV
jgi:F-type H+-transporting ATPase subunit a